MTFSQRDSRWPLFHRLNRSSVKAAAVFLLFFPERGGARRTHLASIKSSVHEDRELWAATVAKVLVKACAQASLAAHGTRFSVRAGAAATSASEGKVSVLGASRGSPEEVWREAHVGCWVLRSAGTQERWTPLPVATQP